MTVFKLLLGSEKNKPLAISFINNVLKHAGENHRVTDLNFIHTMLNPTRLEGEQSCVDILGVDVDGKRIVIEM
jgi:predicted transposase/invertase (TIGR01784 family)